MKIKEMYKKLEELGGFTTDTKELNEKQLKFLEENNDWNIYLSDLLNIIEEYYTFDFAEIGKTYKNPTELARIEIDDCFDIPSSLYDYIDLEKFGKDMIEDNRGFYELRDGEIAYISL